MYYPRSVFPLRSHKAAGQGLGEASLGSAARVRGGALSLTGAERRALSYVRVGFSDFCLTSWLFWLSCLTLDSMARRLLNVRVSEQGFAALDELAATVERPRSDLVRLFLAEGLAKYEPTPSLLKRKTERGQERKTEDA